MRNIVIVGSGITGLIASILLKNKFPDKNIIIVEKDAEIGGLLKSYKYENDLVFDHGMHNFNETGIKDLDKILWDILGDDWQVLEGNNRDLAGLYFNNKLQLNSIYPDIRSFEESDLITAIGETISLKNKAEINYSSVYNYGNSTFGKSITEKVIRPSLEKIFGHRIENLHHTAALIAPLERVVAFDQELMDDFQKSIHLRNSFAYTDQRLLPLEFSSGKRSLYPKKYGTWRILHSLRKTLEEKDVTLLTSHSIQGIEIRDGRFNKLVLNNVSGNFEITDVDSLIWTTNLAQLYKLLFNKFPDAKPDPLKKTVLINILLEKELDCGDLHYFHCYDPKFRTFRVNNYFNYCSNAKLNNGYPVCVEMLIEENLVDTITEDDGIDELKGMGLIKDNNVLFARKEILNTGFPMPTLKNISIIDEMRDKIQKLNCDNLIIAGILSENNLFFQRHVLPNLYEKVNRL